MYEKEHIKLLQFTCKYIFYDKKKMLFTLITVEMEVKNI